VSVNLWLLENVASPASTTAAPGRAQTFNEVAAAVINTLRVLTFRLKN
jgi:hypothetical protein